jgi:glycosyltransferase involved in cell wall biosynthesis
MGYEDMNLKHDFVIRAYESESQKLQSLVLAKESDAIIMGSAPDYYMDERMKENKLAFRYAERFLKKGTYRRFVPTTYKKIFNNYIKYKNKNFHVLCASAYTAYDLALCGMKRNLHKWGYFPEIKKHNLYELMKKKAHDIVKILWVGRLIDWKRTKDAIEMARRLRNEGYSFSLDIIGSGYLEQSLKDLVRKHNLSGYVSFMGSIPPDQVRSHMEEANILLFTSNFNEGWGAVLNEAMNSGCAVVASHAVGSVPYLLEHGKNGFIYRYGDNDDFYKKVKYLLENPKCQVTFGIKSYYTLKNTWNADVAAESFLQLTEGILHHRDVKFEDGPCSKADIIKNSWFAEK